MNNQWNGLPYRPISQYYMQKFGEKVYKIPVSVADDCPNRRGLKGMQACVFCDEWGSAARVESFALSLPEQIQKFSQLLGDKYKAKAFLVYFQAYTTTFVKLMSLRESFTSALAFPFVKGLVVGTRPDCLSRAVIDLWKELGERSYLNVEFGVQSFFDHHLGFLKRGHSGKVALDGIHRTAKESGADIGIHLIFGLPGETDQEVIQTARICNDLPISSVKLHNLHVLQKTPLAEMFAAGSFQPIEFEAYADRVRLFLEHLAPHLYIHRLAAHAPREAELIAPAWTADKMKTHQGIIDHIQRHSSYQSASLRT